MGRKRSVSQEEILDAAERVVAAQGAANLTIDRVANEAGISKATVLYDFKCKQAVLEAVVERAFKRDNELHAVLENELGALANATIQARIAAASEPPTGTFRNAALNLSAALILDETLRAKMQDAQAKVLDRIRQSSASPRGAQLAYLALEGLKLLEHFDFYHFENEERQRVLAEIRWLIEAQPKPTLSPA